MFKVTRFRIGLLIGLVALIAFPLASSLASPTGIGIDPEFQSYYEQSGGLPVFGYALSEPGEEDGRLVQYFERQRLELHPEHAGTPYIVLLGHLGWQDAERRGLLDHDAFQPRISSNGRGDFFPETGHNLSGIFQDYWHSHGLNFGDQGVSFRESLALFGYPVSEEFTDPATGLTTQYFERARFEHHPEHADTQYEVLLGHLGHSEIDFLRENGRGPDGAGPPGQRGRNSDVNQASQPEPTATPQPESTAPPSPDLVPTPAPEPTATPQPEPTSPPPPDPVPSPQPTSSIQQLVDRAASGATVRVPAGIYRETVTITKPITLIAEPGAEIRGDDENGNVVREYWIVGRADNVTIDGFTMRYARNRVQTGAITNNGHNNWTIQNNIMSHAAGANVSVNRGDNLKLINNEIHHAGQLGVHGGGDWFSDPQVLATNILIEGNVIHSNNTDGHDPGWEAGGMKLIYARGVEVINNEVYDNRGPGLWLDIDVEDTVIEGNRVHHNDGMGIIYELSRGGMIRNNVVYENAPNSSSWAWGAGILVQNSSHTTVQGNLVAWNGDGIAVVSQDRTLTRWNNVTNNLIQDNDILMVNRGGDEIAVGWLQDWDGILGHTNSNNRGENNRYYHWNPGQGSWAPLRWPGNYHGWNDLEGFSQTPGERNGSYLSDQEVDELVRAAGLPVRPD